MNTTSHRTPWVVLAALTAAMIGAGCDRRAPAQPTTPSTTTPTSPMPPASAASQ